MLVLLMIISSLLGFIFYIINMKFLNSLKNFSALWNECLIERFLSCRLIGVANMSA
jgi:hypothetical protein